MNGGDCSRGHNRDIERRIGDHASIRTQTKPFSSRVPPISIMDAIEFVDMLYLVIAKAYNAVTDAFHRFRITYDGYQLITEDFWFF
jgi:hypothetical protein